MTRTPLRRRYWHLLTGSASAGASRAAQPRARRGYGLARRYLASLLDIPLPPRPTQNPQVKAERKAAVRTSRAPSAPPIVWAPPPTARAVRSRRNGILTSAAAVAAIGAGVALFATFSSHENSPPVGLGSPAPGTSALGSATAATALDFSDLTPVSGSFESTDSNPIVNGETVTSSLAQDIGCVSGGSVSYDISDLGPTFNTFDATLGLDDNSLDPNATPTVEIYGDSRLLGSYTAAAVGKPPVSIDVDIAGVTTLRFVWSYPATGAAAGSTCRPVSTLVIGEPVLVPA